ncbi:MAG: SDR family oxidoreductase [Acidimicrobiaceae bacterium]|nr:SDR family oxidoreductase [Acidimicrobiaceae bacterium]
MSRDILVVGGDDPATALASELSGNVLHVAPGAEEVDDGFVDGVRRADGTAVNGLDLVVHALYPQQSRTPARIDEMTEREWAAACDDPLEAAIRLARGSHRHLAARQGTIVFCVPLVGAAGAASFVALSALAEGLRVLARSLARSWGPEQIRAHAVTLHPSMFLAPEHAATAATALHDPALGRLPSATEIAAVIDALADDRVTAGLTGASLVMDGGTWMAG